MAGGGWSCSASPTTPTWQAGADTDPAFEESAASGAVAAILAGLPREQAEIVLLRVIGGFSAAEVALITDRPAATVRVLQHRALKRLARELGESGETP